MASPTLPALSRTALAQVINEQSDLFFLAEQGDRFGLMRALTAHLREQGLYTVKISDVYAVCSEAVGVTSPY